MSVDNPASIQGDVDVDVGGLFGRGLWSRKGKDVHLGPRLGEQGGIDPWSSRDAPRTPSLFPSPRGAGNSFGTLRLRDPLARTFRLLSFAFQVVVSEDTYIPTLYYRVRVDRTGTEGSRVSVAPASHRSTHFVTDVRRERQ